jgi:hypothetical protein
VEGDLACPFPRWRNAETACGAVGVRIADDMIALQKALKDTSIGSQLCLDFTWVTHAGS